MTPLKDTLIIKETTEQETVSEPVTEEVTENVIETTSSQHPDQDKPTVKEFSRANIEARSEQIRLSDTDEDNKLDLFCYIKCSDEDDDFLKQCRGVVFNENTLVMKAFPYTTEYNDSDEQVETTLKDFKNCTFYEAHEGALIRMFYFNDKWFVSTHRKLNAFKSKWASNDSFGSAFKKALTSELEHNETFKNKMPEGDNILERFQTLLDKDKQYMFLVLNNEDNRIVCDPPTRPTLFHVGTFVEKELVQTEDVSIPYPKKLTFSNTKELYNFVKDVSYRDLQGVICFAPNNVQIKVLNRDYQDLFRARGNEPSIKYRYLQVRMNRRLTNMLYHLYPNMTKLFDEYENNLYNIASGIYTSYVQRFIKKRYVTVPREEFAVIRECHTWHLADRTENRISLNQVIRILNKQSPTQINHMIRRYNSEQLRKIETQNVTRPRSNSIRSTKSFEQSPVITNIPDIPISPLILSQK